MSELNRKKNVSRCWEFFNCSEQLRENCEAYSSNKRECWLLNNLRGGARLSNNGDCIECKWLKHNIGDYNIKYSF